MAAGSAAALVAAQAETEEHGCDEQRRPGAPGEAEGVGADFSGLAVGVEGVASHDKCSTATVLV